MSKPCCLRLMGVLVATAASAFAGDTAEDRPQPPEHIPGAGRPTPFMPKPEINWDKTAEAPGYDDDVAHAPKYDPKRWPGLTGDEPFFTQKWPEGRVYIRKGGQWVDENGQRVAKAVFGDTTDVVLPSADKPYSVGIGSFRHATIGRNASLKGSGNVFGNLWVKHGGSFRAKTLRTIGSGQRFLRNDNTKYPDRLYPRRVNRVSSLSHYARFAGSGALWVFGANSTFDEFFIDADFIVGPDSIIQPGRNAHPHVAKGAKLVLLDGAYFGNWSNTMGKPDLTCDGTIQGGLPEKPLKRMAMLGLHFKNYSGRPHPALVKDPNAPGSTSGAPRNVTKDVPTLGMAPGTALRAYTTDPERAPFVIGWTGFSPSTHIFHRQRDYELEAWYHRIPRRLKIEFGKGVTVENVTFDHVLKGGLIVESRTDFEQWRNVRFGEHCEGKPAELVTVGGK